MKSVLALSMLCIAQQVTAKIGFGACPIIGSAMTYAQYQNAFIAATTYNHKFVYGDNSLDDLISFIKQLGVKLPKF